MSENAENNNAATDVSVVDLVMDGENQSLVTPEQQNTEVRQTETEAPETADAKAAEESAAAEKNTAENEDLKAAKQQIDNLSKRLHDTQSAFHRASEERSRLEKELKELQSKKENDDDWFSDEDKSKMNKLSDELQENTKQMQHLESVQEQNQQQAALLQWNLAAAEVIKENPDFEDIVYNKFAPMIAQDTGDPVLRAMWDAQEDKSPANAYKVAKTVLAMQEMQNDPDAYRAKIRAEIEAENQTKTEETPDSGKVEGKAGLDLLNSADAPMATDTYNNNESAVDFVFK